MSEPGILTDDPEDLDEDEDDCGCDYQTDCCGTGFVECMGCGGDICVCAECNGQSVECPGCPSCPDDDGGYHDDGGE